MNWFSQHLFQIVKVKKDSGGGFSKGTITIEGSRPETELQEKLYIAVKNENYLAYICDDYDGKTYLATVPDLISLVNEDGSAITTEMVQKGLKVSVIAMPCNPLWTTKKGMDAGGPVAFGCPDVPYKPVGKYKSYPPIPQIKTGRWSIGSCFIRRAKLIFFFFLKLCARLQEWLTF